MKNKGMGNDPKKKKMAGTSTGRATTGKSMNAPAATGGIRQGGYGMSRQEQMARTPKRRTR